MKEKNHAGAQVGVQAICAVLFLAIGLIQACARPSQPELDVEERLIHQRAFESVVWSIPMMNFKAMRDALKESAGVDFNDVAYSKVQTWDPVLFPVIDLRHDQGIAKRFVLGLQVGEPDPVPPRPLFAHPGDPR